MKKTSAAALVVLLLLCCIQAKSQSPQESSFTANGYTFRLTGDLAGFTATFSSRTEKEGLCYVTLVLHAGQPVHLQPLHIRWSHPLLGVAGVWTPGRGLDKNLNASGNTAQLLSRATTHAPVTVLYGYDNSNRLSFACSDALNALVLAARVNESTAMTDCDIQLFTEPLPATSHYELTIRLDNRPVPYWEALKDISSWWAAMPLYRPSPVPDKARWPMYSTWYSFHQQLNPDSILQQCRLAHALGCETVIVDDGWQTLNNTPGYAYTGDWEPVRLPQMKMLTEQVHALGMRCMLWYSVPFVGEASKACALFKGKYLYYRKRWQAYALDPRFPEVRAYLVGKYRDALLHWNLDGLKLDFVDLFVPGENTIQTASDGRDYASINEAVDRLLTDVMTELKAIKPEVMIEFRQSYTGPLMRKYGNMFRAGDTPNDALTNRVSTTDIRLLCAQTAAHADMLMWNSGEKTELAALQLLNVLFAVPQVSVKLDAITPGQLKMLRFWLQYWRANRTVLLDAPFMPLNPAANYPLITARDSRKQVSAVYAAGQVVEVAVMPERMDVINATAVPGLVIDLPKDAGTRRIRVLDCMGNIVSDTTRPLAAGLLKLEVPAAGLVSFE